jgi:UDP-N-acetyl-D-galactosamine dehydrogenase
MHSLKDLRVAVVGLGYVGLPLALALGKKRPVICFDINAQRISELQNNLDVTMEHTQQEISCSTQSCFTNSTADIQDCNFYIVCVPTPIYSDNTPNLSILIKATEMIGRLLQPGDIVVFESTVYPGTTEEVCATKLATLSNLTYNRDFYCGYSPERINPGDKTHTLENIIKVTSGSTPKASKLIDSLYKEVIQAGTHLAPSIKIAESAKIIENVQRDVNIALMNELALLFQKIEVNTSEVLEAASTKWNFLNFKPGLVGGHCIGVDPYYLTFKAESVGFNPKIILSGRELNDSMPEKCIELLELKLHEQNKSIENLKVLILGFTFKENCSDIRNTKVQNLYNGLIQKNAFVQVFDPLVNFPLHELNINYIFEPKSNYYDVLILAVPHAEFVSLGIDKIKKFGKKGSFLFDLKSTFNSEQSELQL